MPNPFVCCQRIQNPRQFIGREQELRAIFDALETAHTGQLQSVSIVGPRRMGRSSLLTHVTQVYSRRLSGARRYILRYIDLQSHAFTADLPTLLAALLRELRDGLPAPIGPDEAALRADLERRLGGGALTLADFEAAFRRFHALPQPFYPVLCLDELEHLTQQPGRFPADLYNSWRSLIDGNHLGLVIATTLPLHELSAQGRLTSPFFNIFSEYLTLGELTEAEANRLIQRGQRCDRPFDAADCARALEWAGHHPLKLQQAGSVIYQAKGERRPNWRQARREYQAKMRRQFGLRTRREQAGRSLQGVTDSLGQVALFVRGQASPNSARLLGGVILGLIVVIILLLLGFPALREWLGGLLSQLTPGATPTP